MERYYEAIDLLKGMISRPSFSRDETAVADFLQAEWQKAGQKVFRKGNNLWIIAPDFDFGKPTLLLNSHIDTVKPASGWTKDPFTPEETEDDQLYGLGSNDAGASVVSLYEAFCILSEKEQPYNLIFLASCEEEVSGKNGIESALAELPPISFAVVGEPTGMQPAVAEKGLMDSKSFCSCTNFRHWIKIGIPLAPVAPMINRFFIQINFLFLFIFCIL